MVVLADCDLELAAHDAAIAAFSCAGQWCTATSRLIVEEAMMIEPTETESKKTLDAFVRVMLSIADEAEKDPAKFKAAPTTTPVGRLDEALAARKPDVNYFKGRVYR